MRGADRILAAAAILLAAAAPAAWAQQAPPPPVLVVRAAMRDITPQAEFTGRVRAVDRVEIRARVGGILGERRFADGQDVTEGAVLFTIDPAPYEAVTQQRKAAIDAAEATLEVAAAQYERAQELWRTRSIPEATLDQRRGDQRRARADLALARAALREAELNLSYTRITAPMAGQIGPAAISPGNLVGPESGPLAVLVRQDPMHVAFSIGQRQMVEARRQAARGLADVRVRLLLPDGSSYAEAGRLDFGGVQADARTDSVPLRAVFPNPGRMLLDGMGVRVVLELAKPQQALLIPQSALLADQQGSYVFVVEPGNRAAIRRVRTEARRDGTAVVLDGLVAGDVVIAEGQTRIRPGAPVTPRPLSGSGS
ncbi:efflux RND transporter periplasmic adaptor subunit [Roseicella aquatilis]|uniref:Efflux RND transporter periplasmic adaptor subunit n=2 Tax=Roseicella aquatilis TaxID=2527868 RepID=A0A4R4DRF3_9PROT|nr:efflux RND transporter periplasmic adaptor subunit [Roseicella aquatilis]